MSRTADREVADLDRDLAIDIGAVELVVAVPTPASPASVPAGASGAEVSAKMRSASYAGIWSSTSDSRAASVAVILAKGRSLMKSRSPCLVTVLTWRIWRLETSSSSGWMRSPLRPKAMPADRRRRAALSAAFGELGELMGIGEGGHQRAAHQKDRGQSGQDRAGKPADADRAADRGLVGRVADDERRLDAEIDPVAAARA